MKIRDILKLLAIQMQIGWGHLVIDGPRQDIVY